MGILQYYAVIALIQDGLEKCLSSKEEMSGPGTVSSVHEKVTINVPLFKKIRDIIDFLGDNHFISHFEGHFKGSKKSRPP